MVYNKYIGIIGGTGTIGSIIVKYLLQLQTHFHVLIGGRRSIKEISMSTFYNSERLKVGSINSIFYFLHKTAEPFNCLEQDNLAQS